MSVRNFIFTMNPKLVSVAPDTASPPSLGLIENHFTAKIDDLKIRELEDLQSILYFDPIDQEKLNIQIENVKTNSICSSEIIDKELIMAFSLNYERIPVLIPFLSKNSLEKNQFIHYDQDLLTILMKNDIDFPVSDILGLEKEEEEDEYEEEEKEKKVLEEELVNEIEKKGIEIDKTKIEIRKKSRIETVIEEDDVESLKLLSNQPNFDFNQKIKKENQLYEYTEIPIILYCIEKQATKCFKFLLLNGSNPLETITNFDSDDESNIDGMTIGAETGNIQIMEMIEEKGGKIDKNCIFGAAKFHQNHILKYIIQKNQNQ